MGTTHNNKQRLRPFHSRLEYFTTYIPVSYTHLGSKLSAKEMISFFVKESPQIEKELLLSEKEKIKITEMCVPTNGELCSSDTACSCLLYTSPFSFGNIFSMSRKRFAQNICGKIFQA